LSQGFLSPRGAREEATDHWFRKTKFPGLTPDPAKHQPKKPVSSVEPS
jgi:hypothetical protein